LLELDELDAVVIATPNHLHEPHVLSALAAKRHVMCERPLSLTSRGVERILTAAARADRTVTVANNHRYRTDVQTLSRFIQGGELGKICGVRAGSYHFKRPAEGWRYRRAESGGGAFLDHGVPLLDLALWLSDFPDPVRVVSHMDRGRAASAVEEAMAIQLECAGGITFLFDVSSAYVGEEERWWFEVLAARGSARLAPLRVVKELNGRPTDVSPTGASGRESAFIQSYRAELAHFLALARGETPYEPPSDQVTLHRVLEAIYKSAEEGKEIRF
jgi:predicted dehydrogenase